MRGDATQTALSTSSSRAPKVSVITVVKNCLPGLKVTMQSLAAQQFRDFEWIVVDGASLDGTQDLARRLFTEGVARGVSGSDSGIYGAMNKGIDLAAGEFLLFLNAGDALAGADTLQQVWGFIHEDAASRPGANPTVYYGAYYIANNAGQRLLRGRSPHRNLPFTMPTCHQAILFPRSQLLAHRYPEDLKIKGDFHLFCQLFASDCGFVYMNVPICVFSYGGLSAQNPLLALREHVRVQKEVLACSLLVRMASMGMLAAAMLARYARLRRGR